MPVSSTKNSRNPRRPAAPGRPLRISAVAKRLGISSSALRAWEILGLIAPQRTCSKYRLYSESDVRLLQRFISERGKIVPSRITAVSTKKQRELAQAIKRARQLALIPYVIR